MSAIATDRKLQQALCGEGSSVPYVTVTLMGGELLSE